MLRRWLLFSFIIFLPLIGGIVLLKSIRTLCGDEFMAIGICKNLPKIGYFETKNLVQQVPLLVPLAWERPSM